MKKLLSFLALILLLTACSGSAENMQKNFPETGKGMLTEKIDSVFNDEMFANAFWGAKIISLSDSSVLYSRNENKLFMPASNEKILTTSTGLKVLGADFRYVSELKYSGVIKDSVLEGNLYLYSNGDPTLYTRFFDSPLHLFNYYTEALLSVGIKKINGNIIGDDSAFEDDHLGYGWAYDGLSVWYSAPFGPLQLNENYVDIKVIAGNNAGDSVTLDPNIKSKYFNIMNNLSTADSVTEYFDYNRGVNENKIVFSGEVKTGRKPFEVSPSIYNPTMFYSTVFKETVERAGISVEGDVLEIKDVPVPEKQKLLYIYESPALSEIATGLMKRSQNLYAETLARTISWYKTGKGLMYRTRQILSDTLAAFGVEPGSYRYMDGSGLSRYNYVAPSHIVKILTGMYNSELKDLWLDVMPIAGVDGTLRNRMKNTPAENNVRAKTGTISNVRGLSGYVTDKNGEVYAFSFLVNSHTRSSADTEIITDKVLEYIAGFEN